MDIWVMGEELRQLGEKLIKMADAADKAGRDMAEQKIWNPTDDRLLASAPLWQKEVEAAVAEYVKEGRMTFAVGGEGEDPLVVAFMVADPLDHIEKQEGLYAMLVRELGNYRPGGIDDSDLFYEPLDEDAPRVRLLQALVRAYQECGVAP